MGDVYTLTAIITPSDATNKSVYWTSDNENVVTISNDGAITAVAKGKATITATTVDGGYTATCEVTVKDPTIATATIPKTGISYKLLVTIGATITIGYIAYRKIKYLNF